MGNNKYFLVDTDYFTKWVEAESLANIRDVDAKKFVWKNIVTQFGVPHTHINTLSLHDALPIYPLCKIICADQEIFLVSHCFGKRPHNV